MSIYCMIYSTKSKKTEIYTSFSTFYFTFAIDILWTGKSTINYQVLLMVIQEASNKTYPSMIAQHQTILVYSVINNQIIYSFEIGTSLFLNLFY